MLRFSLFLFFYTTALCIGPQWFVEEGRKKEEEGKYLEALSLYKEAARLNPSYKEAIEGMGRCYLELTLLKEAEECFKKSLSIQPFSAWAHYWLAMTFWKGGKKKEAEEHFEKAHSILPKNPLILSKFAQFYEEQDAFQKAFSLYKKSIRTDPRFAPSYIGMARLWMKKDEDLSIFYLKKAKQIKGPSAEIALMFSEIFEKRGWISTAIQECEEALEKEPLSLPLLQKIASLYTKEKLYERAERTYKKILKIKEEPLFLFNLGELQRKMKREREALSNFYKAFSLNPYDEFSLHRTSYLSLRWEEIGSPRRIKLADIHKELGKKYFKDKKYTLAYHHYKIATALIPHDEEVRKKRVELLLEMDAIEEALEQLRILCDLSPQNIEYRDKLEELYYRKKESVSEREGIEGVTFLPRSLMVKVEGKGMRIGLEEVFYEKLLKLLEDTPYIKIEEAKDYISAKRKGAEFFAHVLVEEKEDGVKVSLNFVDIERLKEENIQFSATEKWYVETCLHTLISFLKEKIPPLGYIKKVNEPALKFIAGIGWLQGVRLGASLAVLRGREILGKAEVIEVDENVCVAKAPYSLIKKVKIGDLATIAKE